MSMKQYIIRVAIACALFALFALATGCTSTHSTRSSACPQAYGYKNHTYNKPFINH